MLTPFEAFLLLRALYGLELHGYCAVPVLVRLFLTSLQNLCSLPSDQRDQRTQLLGQLLNEADLPRLFPRFPTVLFRSTKASEAVKLLSTEVVKVSLRISSAKTKIKNCYTHSLCG